MTGCLSRWGSHLPAWVCALGGERVQQVRTGTMGAAWAVLGILAASLTGVVYQWRRSGLSFRDWLDSLR